MPLEAGVGRAIACSNIALAKYWGKSDRSHNLPAVPSLSLTLGELVTETEVHFDTKLAQDELILDGRPGSPNETRRVTRMLDRTRAIARFACHARVESINRFPTAAGLASSASGFAALAAASTAAAAQTLSDDALSALARRSSASAARSIFGGFVELVAGAPGNDRLHAAQLAPVDHWDVRLVVALTERGPKAIGSTEAMQTSRNTSPLYRAWVESAPKLFGAIKTAVREKDLATLGQTMEQSTMAFHACAMTSRPSVLYWGPGTVAALRTVRSLRSDGVSAWATMDAGPHVKTLCEAKDALDVEAALRRTPGVHDVIVASPGPGVEVARC
ncbi:MAG: diphosphomevalonate decarboxylase [Myxococcota bacterium]